MPQNGKLNQKVVGGRKRKTAHWNGSQKSPEWQRLSRWSAPGWSRTGWRYRLALWQPEDAWVELIYRREAPRPPQIPLFAREHVNRPKENWRTTDESNNVTKTTTSKKNSERAASSFQTNEIKVTERASTQCLELNPTEHLWTDIEKCCCWGERQVMLWDQPQDEIPVGPEVPEVSGLHATQMWSTSQKPRLHN